MFSINLAGFLQSKTKRILRERVSTGICSEGITLSLSLSPFEEEEAAPSSDHGSEEAYSIL